MTLIATGVALWMLAHFFKRMAPGLRERLGNAGRGLVAVIILAGVVLMYFGYRGAAIVPVYTPMPGIGHLSSLLMLVGIFCFGIGSSRGSLSNRIRHPMLWGMVIWAVAHLLVNGDLASVILFGGLGLWALIEMVVINRAAPDWTPARAARDRCGRQECGHRAGDLRNCRGHPCLVRPQSVSGNVWMKLYRFPSADDTPAFCHKVSAALSDGWELHGDPAHAHAPRQWRDALRAGRRQGSRGRLSPGHDAGGAVMAKADPGRFFRGLFDRPGDTSRRAEDGFPAASGRSVTRSIRRAMRFIPRMSSHAPADCQPRRLTIWRFFHVVFGKTVPDISLNALANLGYAEGRWHRPVHAGDTLRAVSEVIGIRQNANGGSGIVWVRTRGLNQRDEAVIDYVRWGDDPQTRTRIRLRLRR